MSRRVLGKEMNRTGNPPNAESALRLKIDRVVREQAEAGVMRGEREAALPRSAASRQQDRAMPRDKARCVDRRAAMSS